ncbi:MAG: ATP-binding protein [Isosphaeraceae bacterium]
MALDPARLTAFLFAAQSFDVERHAVAILAAVFAALTLFVALIYIHQINNRHARLLGDLEKELAERRRAEEALRASEGFYHSLVESLPAAILRKDILGRFTFGNQKFQSALGILSPDQLRGKTDFDFYPRVMAEKYRADDRQVMETNEVLETVEENISAQGERRFVQVIKTPLHDPQGQVIGVQGIFWDVTERKAAEEQLVLKNIQLQEMAESEREAHAALKQAQSQLVQSEKLASLGQIVAGVAHEINNPVAFVTNNVAVLGRDVGEMRDLIALYEEADDLITADRPELAGRIHEFRDRVDMGYTLSNIQGLLHRSRDGLRRIQQIVSHLRLFAHLDEGDVNEADLNDGIESTAAIIVGHARKKQIRLTMELGPLPPVTCNAARINQVVMNLLTNAIDACHEGGSVTVRSRAEEGGVCIEVSDDGCGIPQEVRNRIFDPFFTTKPIGQGSGLGLSISYGIVKDHGGTIDVESTPGQGARFVLHLPLKPAPKRPAAATTPAQQPEANP